MGEPDLDGLLALMLLTESRRAARSRSDGTFVDLREQDRSLWDETRIDEGQAIVRKCLARNEPGSYQVQAAIAAVHSDAPTSADTDWEQSVALYDHLLRLQPSPVVALNRAVAIAELEGPVRGLALVDATSLTEYQPFHIARAECLARLGRYQEARAAWTEASKRTDNHAQRELIARRLSALGSPG